MSVMSQGSLILGMQRRGYSLHEIAAALSIPVRVVEQTLRTAGNPICEQTGKRCYSSPHQARKGNATASNKIRVYRCEHGHHWHVTSQREPTDQQGRRRRRDEWK